jgi:N-acetylglucosaminyl-diphospho-decaprenol L-rhamnosyltransferase
VSAPALSIDAVVVAYNSRATLRACVKPLVDTDGVHVTVVDNASPDDSAAAIDDLAARIVRAPRNGGFSYGCNLGASGGSAEHVLLINPDARIDSASLGAMADALASDPRAGAVGPRILDETGALVWSQRRFPRLRSTFSRALFLHRLFPHTWWSDEVVRDAHAYIQPGSPDWLSGACILIRRSLFEELGGLDERFFLYSEDTDLCLRLRDAGFSVRYEPGATAHHQGGASSEPHSTAWVEARSRVRYARKHRSAFVAMAEALGTALEALTHGLVWIHRPRRARAHAAAARAALGALGPSGAKG